MNEISNKTFAQHYTALDHEVWSLLFERQIRKAEGAAYPFFLLAIKKLDLDSGGIPDFHMINSRLHDLTGWSIYAVPGLIPNADFFHSLVARSFGITTWIRKMDELDYLEQPDMFHDLFGHVPLLVDLRICSYLHGLGVISSLYPDNEMVIESIARLYWYTIEFGLVRVNNKVKIYGAGILSSMAETDHCLSEQACIESFDLEKVLATPYIKDKFQEQYFILDSIDDLNKILIDLEAYLKGEKKLQCQL